MKNNNRIKGMVLLMLLAVTGLAKAQQWQELNTGVTEDLYDICCIDTNTVFVCGRNGLILKSEDGGNSWQEKYRQTDCQLYRIKFFDSNNGFVLGDDNNYNNILLKTSDGGDSWLDMGNPFTEYNPTSPYSCDLFLVDPDTLYVASDQLMKSTDGGNSFFQLEVGWLNDAQDMYFEGNVGYIVWGMLGDFQGTHIAKTINYGSSWEEILTFDSENEGINKTMFHDKDHVSVYGAYNYNDNELCFEHNEIRTDDGFATCQWLQNEDLIMDWWPPISGVCFSDSQNGIIVYYWEDFSYPYSGIISYQTNDGGNTWRELNALNGPGIGWPAIGGREGVYYLALGSGRVYKLEGTYDGVVEKKENVYVFPNPANDRVVIEGIEAAEVQIFNAIGQCVASAKCKGERITLDISNLPFGIYFVNITDGEGRKCVKKVVKE